ncbi:MAG: ABC transporter permease [Fretibacterium sp.]|uniref:ABC transporter permease n=1 Tax=Fretibacterium sp. OH1220_COT-178 TaxID=2491047 RepID=UPI000F5FB8A2|nr:ABC transporter permease [Fretibacterium sp. OH1220_COT-178]MDO4786223.1 ABC transporter permease [Fretibacterium sp.]RRD64537.1 ABC transporter permease [Fretibacterium sp. OH1220_COT-178]
MELLRETASYYAINGGYVLEQFWRHFLISVYGVLFAAALAIPTGFLIARRGRLAGWVIGAANVIQTVPSLALMSVLMLGLGLGVRTVIVTVLLYSLLPIVRNTYAGIRSIEPQVLDAARGMGMTELQRIFMVELPLALSVIMAGVRNALVVAIGVTTIGTFIGAGGLGDIISRGVNVANGSAIIVAGALPTALMAVCADVVLGVLERRLDPTR